MSLKFASVALAATLGLAACGDTIGEQALSGAVIGAAGTALFNGDVGTGAVVGAVGGIAYCQIYDGARCN
ncbi:hypothetical protein [uncultured Tateyamaria sp.]|uniref:hypothetical protein n=1 Tax=uncultured Tateyamaria sp. TaxID=455651 RepID=UPI0026345865|nr:hypothetical protein [uncultured Tateyamaria sp.]